MAEREAHVAARRGGGGRPRGCAVRAGAPARCGGRGLGLGGLEGAPAEQELLNVLAVVRARVVVVGVGVARARRDDVGLGARPRDERFI